MLVESRKSKNSDSPAGLVSTGVLQTRCLEDVAAQGSEKNVDCSIVNRSLYPDEFVSKPKPVNSTGCAGAAGP